MSYSTSKNSRILDIYARLCEGKKINKKEESMRFGVAWRTIQRDIEDIRAFLEERTVLCADTRTVEYNRAGKHFEMCGNDGAHMSDSEILATCKILLASRGFAKKEMDSVLRKLIAGCTSPQESKLISDLVNNERFHYTEPENQKPVKDIILDIGRSIKEQNILELTYNRLSFAEEQVKCFVEPLSIVFFDCHFYLLANPLTKNEKGYKKSSDSHMLYRFDRIVDCNVTDDKFCKDYNNRIEEGFLRNQLQLIYANGLESSSEHIRSCHSGVSIA